MNKNLNKIYIVGVLVASLVFLSACSKENEVIIPKEKPNQFGLDVSGLIEVCDTIKTDETISDILTPHSVTPKLVHDLEKKALDVYPLRNIQAEKELYIYAKWDSVETVKYLVYVINAVDYVVYDLRDSINVYKKQKPVTIKQSIATGVITSSLWSTLKGNNNSDKLAQAMEDVYGWSIDFFTIQPQDSFKIIYEEIFVDDKPTDIGNILAASFTHRKENFYAFYFDKEKEGKYFDEKGNSLKKMFLKAPLKYTRISSRFSLSRYHPILHRVKAHLGTDYAAPSGTPIMSVGNGTVIETGYSSGNGNYVKIKHNRTYTTQYLHMSRFAKGIHRGVYVTQGQVIGYVGSTGLATGPHLCFRFWRNDKQVNPVNEKYQSSGPVSKKNKSEFEIVKNEWIKKLNGEDEKLYSTVQQSRIKS